LFVVIVDIIHSGESLSVKNEVKMPVQGNCTKCGYISSQPLCKACVLLEGLNRGLPRLEGGLVTNHTQYDRLMKSFVQKKLQ
jgi:cytoplasmic tRNA 2-thiolation protein 1